MSLKIILLGDMGLEYQLRKNYKADINDIYRTHRYEKWKKFERIMKRATQKIRFSVSLFTKQNTQPELKLLISDSTTTQNFATRFNRKSTA